MIKGNFIITTDFWKQRIAVNINKICNICETHMMLDDRTKVPMDTVDLSIVPMGAVNGYAMSALISRGRRAQTAKFVRLIDQQFKSVVINTATIRKIVCDTHKELYVELDNGLQVYVGKGEAGVVTSFDDLIELLVTA